MKVLFITLINPRIGKANVDIFHNANRLSELGHEIHLVTRKQPGFQGKHSLDDSITVHRLASSMPYISLLFFPIFFMRVIIAAGKIQPDVIAAENNLHAPFAGFLAGKIWRIPYGFLLRELTADSIFHDHSQYILKRWGAWLLMKSIHFLLRRTPNKLSINQGISDYYRKVIGQSITSEWLIGYDLEGFSISDNELMEVRKKYNLVEGRKYLLYAGSLDKHRGLSMVFMALDGLGKESRYHLLITGEGKGIDSLKQFVAQADLEDRVTFLDWIEERDLYCVARLAQIGIEPYERLWPQDHTPSTKIALYIAANLLVLAKPAPGYAELIQPGMNFHLFRDAEELRTLLRDFDGVKSNLLLGEKHEKSLVDSKRTSKCLEAFLIAIANSE